MVPEVLAFPHPIGFDTVHYADRMVRGVVWDNWSSVFTSSWLLYALIVPAYEVLRGDPFLLLKVVAPLLYGLNVAGIYYFARKGLSWSVKKSLVAGGFFAFQFAALRISWDLLRNLSGLGLLVFALSLTYKLESRRGFLAFAVLSLLAVFAHEYAAVILLAVVSWIVLRNLLNDKGMSCLRLMLASLPAFAVFAVGLCLRFFPIHYVVETNVINAGDIVQARAGGVFFLTNYLGVNDGVEFYPSYLDLALHVSVLFAVLYLSYVLLVWKGVFREDRLDSWSGLLIVGAFGCLVLPFSALLYWSRWMFMLAYPFTFYAVNGLEKLRRYSSSRRSWFGEFKQLGKGVKVMMFVTVLLGASYLATPPLVKSFGGCVASVPPVSGYFSVAPAVPYEDVDDVIQAFEWIDANADEDSCVLLMHAFATWGTLHLDKSIQIVRFHIDGDKALEVAEDQGFHSVYFVWWKESTGWFLYVKLPSDFLAVQDFGRISVLKHLGS